MCRCTGADRCQIRQPLLIFHQRLYLDWNLTHYLATCFSEFKTPVETCTSPYIICLLIRQIFSVRMRTLLHRYFVAYYDAKAAQNIAGDILFYKFLILKSRSFSLRTSFFAIESRLSYIFLPLPSPISTLHKPFLIYTCKGTIV